VGEYGDHFVVPIVSYNPALPPLPKSKKTSKNVKIRDFNVDVLKFFSVAPRPHTGEGLRRPSHTLHPRRSGFAPRSGPSVPSSTGPQIFAPLPVIPGEAIDPGTRM